MDSEALLVDEQLCQGCHQVQFQDWQDSHHQLAMLSPGDATVRGDFNNASLRTDTEITHFFRQNDEFWVRTPDATGTTKEYRVAYTFGWEPLQQYLLEGEGGRLQALGAAWDTEQNQWFHLYDGQGVDAQHPLHWHQPAQNANTQCIECHTSGFQLGYDAMNDRFDTRWHNLGVGCQSCHGPASEHLQWAQSSNTQTDPHKGFAQAMDRGSHQLETCAQCHSRRTPLGEPAPEERLDDAYLVSQLTADLYEVDGKIHNEVFEHGSFMQSHMQRAGVVCSDCHNPHSGQLQTPGNAVCTQCHNPSGRAVRTGVDARNLNAGNYDSSSHHHHEPDSEGAQCVSCHMPGKLYMGNDLRHDHSFSSPNPEQALALGHSDACLSCHNKDDTERVTTQFRQWFPDHSPRDGGYARALFKARNGEAGAAEVLLAQLTRSDLSNLRHAALLAELPNYPSQSAQQQVIEALSHEDANVRRAAINAAPALLDVNTLQHQLNNLLQDPRRSVRLSAAEQLLLLAEQAQAPVPTEPFEEYEQIQSQLLANAEAHFNLASLYRVTGQYDRVEASLRAAQSRNSTFSSATIALAQWLDGEAPGSGLAMLEEHLHEYPQDADLHHALGLARIRARQIEAGVSNLEQAHALVPDNAHYAYVLAIAWYDTGRQDQALQLMRDQLAQNPANRSLRLALLNYLPAGRERQQLLDELYLQNPDDPVLEAIP